jgi:uncharacterized protein
VRPVIQYVVAHLLTDRALVGYRVAIIGDLHIAPWQSTRALAQSVDAINASQPDLVALVGDYGYSVDHVQPLSRAMYRAIMPRVLRELARLRAPDGVCAVLGNHDLDAGGDLVQHGLLGIGVTVLRNAQQDIQRNGALLRVFGIDDIKRQNPDSQILGDQLFRGTSAVLLLSHHPDFVLGRQPLPAASPLLIASGHTHGGQITFPLVGAPVTLAKIATRHYAAGFVPNDVAALYITRGLGEQVPIRVGAAREITLLELAQR